MAATYTRKYSSAETITINANHPPSGSTPPKKLRIGVQYFFGGQVPVGGHPLLHASIHQLFSILNLTGDPFVAVENDFEVVLLSQLTGVIKDFPVELSNFHCNQFIYKIHPIWVEVQWAKWLGCRRGWCLRQCKLQQNQHSFMSNQNSIGSGRSLHKDNTLPSTTKYAYQFAKTRRFPDPNPICPEAFYSFDSQLSNRKAGLGFGKKVDFQKLLPNTPASNRYRIKSSFQAPKGVSFGLAREKSPDKSYLIPQLHRNPGPGQYENQFQTRMRQNYSLHSKTIDVVEKAKMCHHTPGPGAYESPDFEGPSKQTNSKYGNSKLGTIDPNLKRFPQIKLSPGPTSYHNEDGILGSGHYTLSRHAGNGGRVFSRQARFTGQQWRPSRNPGPGNYLVPTQFGEPEPLHNMNS